MEIYVVKSGDTLSSIAQQFGVPLSQIVIQNELEEDQPLVVGQNIVITFPNRVYTVRDGDTLQKIATDFGVSIMELLQNNPQLKGKDEIFEGQVLFIDYKGEKRGNICVNGYIYPFVNRDTLIRTLPYLTYLTLFTYGFMPDGALIDRGITEYGLKEDEIISLSYDYGVKPIMHLSTLTDAGVFSSELGNNLLNNEQAQNVLVDNIIKKMKEKGYYGFDVDFEYLDSSNRDKYTAFVQKLGNALRENGYILITALIPKSSADQPGALYESHDYGGLASVSDYVLLMTYEWGYTFGPPMAVAPLNEVEKVVGYALSEINADKIFLGVPNYGYDWPLPYESGRTKAAKVTNVGAVRIAADNGVNINFDAISKCPYFNYKSQLVEHVVWFDDAQSIEAKLGVIPQNGLYGVSYWNLMEWFPQNWLVLNQQYNIEKIL